MDIARRNNLKRIVRCGQIMGRSEEGEMSAAQIFYPCMQCADIFFLKVSTSGYAHDLVAVERVCLLAAPLHQRLMQMAVCRRPLYG